jgi:hypothetical protein
MKTTKSAMLIAPRYLIIPFSITARAEIKLHPNIIEAARFYGFRFFTRVMNNI